MNRNILTLAVASLLWASLSLPQRASALPALPLQFGGQNFSVNQVLGDGKNGRAFGKWSQGISERPVQSVSVTMRRQSGGDGTYVNLRFGNGPTLENGKREYLRDGGTVTFTWNVGGIAPNGQPLVLNAYDGEVLVQSARISYSGQPTPRPRQPFDDGDRGYDEGYGGGRDDRYDQDRYDQGGYDQGGSQQGGYLSGDRNRGAEERCRRARVQRPRIDIGRVSGSGGVFSGKYKIQGSIYGACVQEAGYFEEGRMKEAIRFPLDDRYNRQEFQFTARSGRRGEVRVYTTDGREDLVAIDDILQNSGGAGR